MQRPRNRQPRTNHGQSRGNKGRGGARSHSARTNQHTEYHAVPNSTRVIAGAQVSIVLKEDQPTGREVQGTVRDLLSHGDHPRGIKVRLTDGRIGRVQRMVDGYDASSNEPVPSPEPMGSARSCETNDLRVVDSKRRDGLPPRSLADYVDHALRTLQPAEQPAQNVSTATCPVCGSFEGDEVAVSHHVESHFT